MNYEVRITSDELRFTSVELWRRDPGGWDFPGGSQE